MNSFVAGHAEVRNRLKHWSRKTSTAQKADRAGDVSVATDIVKTEVATQGVDHYVRLPEVRTMIDRALLEFKMERDS